MYRIYSILFYLIQYISGFTGSMKCDPEAEKFKLKFKKNKDDLVSILFKLFNKEVFDDKVNHKCIKCFN